MLFYSRIKFNRVFEASSSKANSKAIIPLIRNRSSSPKSYLLFFLIGFTSLLIWFPKSTHAIQDRNLQQCELDEDCKFTNQGQGCVNGGCVFLCKANNDCPYNGGCLHFSCNWDGLPIPNSDDIRNNTGNSNSNNNTSNSNSIKNTGNGNSNGISNNNTSNSNSIKNTGNGNSNGISNNNTTNSNSNKNTGNSNSNNDTGNSTSNKNSGNNNSNNNIDISDTNSNNISGENNNASNLSSNLNSTSSSDELSSLSSNSENSQSNSLQKSLPSKNSTSSDKRLSIDKSAILDPSNNKPIGNSTVPLNSTNQNPNNLTEVVNAKSSKGKKGISGILNLPISKAVIAVTGGVLVAAIGLLLFCCFQRSRQGNSTSQSRGIDNDFQTARVAPHMETVSHELDGSQYPHPFLDEPSIHQVRDPSFEETHLHATSSFPPPGDIYPEMPPPHQSFTETTLYGSHGASTSSVDLSSTTNYPYLQQHHFMSSEN
ncbi:hypothetical protein G9A89_014288 [Geosiphon pyriformis]|nr:hypothetical protein G9A89_014288 [Geosiphon pyriformis]